MQTFRLKDLQIVREETKQEMIKEFEKIINNIQDWGGFQELKQKLKEIN